MHIQSKGLTTRVEMKGDSSITVEGVRRVLVRPVSPPPEGEAWNFDYSRELIIETAEGVIEVELSSEQEDALIMLEEGNPS